jgi:hypothetical protein
MSTLYYNANFDTRKGEEFTYAEVIEGVADLEKNGFVMVL